MENKKAFSIENAYFFTWGDRRGSNARNARATI